jgi:hypothetical protein
MDSISADTLFCCDEIVKGECLPIVFKYDKYGALTHIGWCLMSAIDTTSQNPIAISFIERMLLSELVSNDVERILTGVKENDIIVIVNGKPVIRNFYSDKSSLLKLLSNISSVKVEYSKNQYKVTLFCNSEQEVSFLFPADNELLTGMNKRESDQWLALQLKNHIMKQERVPIHEQDSCFQFLNDSIFVSRGIFFRIPQISNDLYYLKTDSAYSLIFDRELAPETFSNILRKPFLHTYIINISHDLYGEIEENYTVSSHDFDDYFFEHYDRYFGVETMDIDKLTGTLIFSDRYVGSFHMAYVEIGLDELMRGGTMKMKLYSNIPIRDYEKYFKDNNN